MKNTVMPASLLMKSSLLNAFYSSGKKHLIITGGRQSGKTTLLRSVADADILTYAIKKQGVYLKSSASGKETQIGIYQPLSEGDENRMQICEYGFLNLGISAIKACLNSDKEFAVIDEIGYLESDCEPYCNAILELFENKRVMAVVRKQDTVFTNKLLNLSDTFTVDLDNPFGNVGLVIMASGESKRFGSNKLIAEFKGKPLITHILDASENIFSKRVVVTRHKAVAEICEKRGIDYILHDLPYRSDTIKLGTQYMSDTKSCAFCPSDQPFLSSETLQSLVLFSASENEFCFRPKCGDTVGAPIIFPKSFYDDLMLLDGKNGGNALIKKHPEMLKYISIRDGRELIDIDTVDDIISLQE